MRILVFGDSIAQGFFDEEAGGWVSRLQNNKFEPTFFNLAISGDASSEVSARFKSETEARIWPDEAFVFIFAIGVNDACINSGKPKATSNEYNWNLHSLIDMAEKFSEKVLFVGLTPCDEAKTTPCAWDGEVVFRNEDILRINTVLTEVCQERNIAFVPVFESFVGREKELLPDGLHPNSKGHELIASLVKPELDKLLT